MTTPSAESIAIASTLFFAPVAIVAVTVRVFVSRIFTDPSPSPIHSRPWSSSASPLGPVLSKLKKAAPLGPANPGICATNELVLMSQTSIAQLLASAR